MTITLSRRGAIAGGIAALAAPSFLAWGGAARAQEAGVPVTTYTRTLGDLELTAISDGYFEFPGPLFVNISDEEIAAAMQAAFATPGRIGITAHLVRGSDRMLLIDTGTAGTFGPTNGRLPAALAAHGVAPADVGAVLLTHMHADHIGGLLAADGMPAFPNATVHVSEADLAFWTDEAAGARAPEGFRPMFARAAATAAAYGDRVVPFGADGEVLPGILTVALPGHTVGHTGFRLRAGEGEILVFGDAVNSSAVQFAHPEAGLVFDTDAAQAAETRARLFDMLAADRTLVAGTHMPFPGIGHVARAGDAYAWAPEEWQYM